MMLPRIPPTVITAACKPRTERLLSTVLFLPKETPRRNRSSKIKSMDVFSVMERHLERCRSTYPTKIPAIRKRDTFSMTFPQAL